MSNGFDADQKWASMLNTYQQEKRNGQKEMDNWKKCFNENLQLKQRMFQNSKNNLRGFNPVRDRFSSLPKDKQYFKERTTFHASKARIKQPESNLLI